MLPHLQHKLTERSANYDNSLLDSGVIGRSLQTMNRRFTGRRRIRVIVHSLGLGLLCYVRDRRSLTSDSLSSVSLTNSARRCASVKYSFDIAVVAAA